MGLTPFPKDWKLPELVCSIPSIIESKLPIRADCDLHEHAYGKITVYALWNYSLVDRKGSIESIRSSGLYRGRIEALTGDSRRDTLCIFMMSRSKNYDRLAPPVNTKNLYVFITWPSSDVKFRRTWMMIIWKFYRLPSQRSRSFWDPDTVLLAY